MLGEQEGQLKRMACPAARAGKITNRTMERATGISIAQKTSGQTSEMSGDRHKKGQKGEAMRFPFAFGTCALLLTALPAVGQDRPTRDPYSTAPRAGSLIGSTVTRDGRQLGRVSDVILTENGAVRDLIIRTADGTVSVPFTEARYDNGERTYVVSTGFIPRRVSETRSLARQDTPSPGDRWSRGGRLVRTEPTPVARIERVPEIIVTRPAAPDAVSSRLQDFAWAARTYGEPTGSVSLTRNIDRLPARSAAFDNYTLPGEVYGFRSPYRMIPPPSR
jgi:hypothetical protein